MSADPGDRDDGNADSAYEAVLDASGWIPDGPSSPFTAGHS